MEPTVYEKLTKAEQSPAWNRAGAYLILKDGQVAGKVLFKFPKDGAGRLEAFLWDWSGKRETGREDFIQHGSAGGYGYDKKTAALGGMEFGGLTLADQGHEWADQIRSAGFEVVGVL